MNVLFSLGLPLVFAMTALAADIPETARQLENVNVLPLALDDQFAFRKVELFLNDKKLFKPTDDKMLAFGRRRVEFGAVTDVDRNLREGHYMTFFWRAGRSADITVRLEYRQEKLGSFVLAKEIDCPGAKGSHATQFQVIGDEYLQDGKVTQWRALLIEDRKIVGLTQSHLWN